MFFWESLTRTTYTQCDVISGTQQIVVCCYINVLNLKCSKSYCMLCSGGTDLQLNKLLFTCFTCMVGEFSLKLPVTCSQIQKCCVGAWFGSRTKAEHHNLHKGRNSCKTVGLNCIRFKQHLEVCIFKQSGAPPHSLSATQLSYIQLPGLQHLSDIM